MRRCQRNIERAHLFLTGTSRTRTREDCGNARKRQRAWVSGRMEAKGTCSQFAQCVESVELSAAATTRALPHVFWNHLEAHFMQDTVGISTRNAHQ